MSEPVCVLCVGCLSPSHSTEVCSCGCRLKCIDLPERLYEPQDSFPAEPNPEFAQVVNSTAMPFEPEPPPNGWHKGCLHTTTFFRNAGPGASSSSPRYAKASKLTREQIKLATTDARETLRLLIPKLAHLQDLTTKTQPQALGGGTQGPKAETRTEPTLTQAMRSLHAHPPEAQPSLGASITQDPGYVAFRLAVQLDLALDAVLTQLGS